MCAIAYETKNGDGIFAADAISLVHSRHHIFIALHCHIPGAVRRRSTSCAVQQRVIKQNRRCAVR